MLIPFQHRFYIGELCGACDLDADGIEKAAEGDEAKEETETGEESALLHQGLAIEIGNPKTAAHDCH